MGSKNNKSKKLNRGSVLAEIRSVGDAPKHSDNSADLSARSKFLAKPFFEWLALFFASLVAYWALTSRLVGVNVSVLIDEYAYVLDTHYQGLLGTGSFYPNHLFQLVYGITKSCGTEFYSCARSMNAVFVIGSGVVVYLLAKYVSGKRWLAGLVWIGLIFGSFGTYTAYFMPEAIFNFFMILFFYGLVRLGQSDRIMTWVSLGTLLGVAALAKPHALFVLPALIIYIFLSTRATKSSYMVQSIKRLGSFVGAALVSKVAIGYLIAGEKGLTLFGSYGGVTVDADFISSTAGLIEGTVFADSTLQNILVTSWGQTLMITMILGFGLAVSVSSVLSSWTRQAENFLANKFRILFGLSILNMMAVAALFEAWLTLINWMHTRYYSYLIPLALIVLVEGYVRSGIEAKPLIKRVVVGIFLVLASVALFTAAVPYGANWVDAPDFRFHIDNIVLSSILILVSIGLAIWWVWDNKTPMLVGLIVASLASTLSGTYISTFLVESFGKDFVHDQLGRVLRNYLPQNEIDKTVLVGDNNTTMERALFGSLSGEAKAILAPDDGYDITNVPPGTLWLVKVGEPLITGLDQPDISGNGYSLYSLSKQNKLQPRLTELTTFSGQCVEEELAEWSCRDATEVVLKEPLGPNAEIDLILEVSEEASADEIEFILGDSVLIGSLPVGTASLTLNFANTAGVGTLTIRSKGGKLTESLGSSPFLKIVSVISVPRD